MPKRNAVLIYWFLAATWIGLIFLGSHDRQSWEHSSRFIAPVLRWLFPGAPERSIQSAVFAVRKAAHVTEYAVLALLIWGALAASGTRPAPDRAWRPTVITLLLVLLFAIGDEWHQSLVPSRQASALDVLIDSAGAVLALMMVHAVRRWRGQK